MYNHCEILTKQLLKPTFASHTYNMENIENPISSHKLHIQGLHFMIAYFYHQLSDNHVDLSDV